MSRSTNIEGLRLIESTAFALFKSVQKLERWRFLAHIIFFAAAITSIYTVSYSLYFITVIAFVAGTSAFVFRLLGNRRNVLGHSLHRISMLAKAYQMNGYHFDVAYLLSKVPPKLHSLAVKNSKTVDPSGKYATPTEEAGANRLRWMIQENAFFNAALYGACAERTLRTAFATTAMVVILLLLMIPMIDGQIEYMVLRVVFMILSLSILYDQIERWANWKVASQVMIDLENELSRFQTAPEHRVLLLFSNYQVAICGSQAISPNVYDDNHDKLNGGWKQRIATLNEEWADAS